MSLELQRVAQKSLRSEIDIEGADLDIGEGAVVVLDPDGGVKALVGGKSYGTSPFDRAVKSLRQPGSSSRCEVAATASWDIAQLMAAS